MKKMILGAVLALATTGASAAPPPGEGTCGHWAEVTRCDYEDVVVGETKTTICNYYGYISSFSGSGWISDWFSDTKVLAGHTSCPAASFIHRYHHYYDTSTHSYKYAWISGHINLTNQQHHTKTHTERRVVEGSCRTEMVWIPGVGIPGPHCEGME